MLVWEVAGYWKRTGERIFTVISSEVWGSKLIRTQVFIRMNLLQAGGTDLLAGELSGNARKAQGQMTQKGITHLQKTFFHFPWGSSSGTDQRPRDVRMCPQRQVRIKRKVWHSRLDSVSCNPTGLLALFNPFSSARECFLRVPFGCTLLAPGLLSD